MHNLPPQETTWFLCVHVYTPAPRLGIKIMFMLHKKNSKIHSRCGKDLLHLPKNIFKSAIKITQENIYLKNFSKL